jgi:ABC-type Mn2+/Zn2+ transport system ATPase subunit
MSNALIRLEQVAVTFAGQSVLDNIELSVEPGQIVTLIGPNGAGKTTLVRAVLGLLKPDSGSVWRKPKLRIGYMPQNCTSIRHCRSRCCASCAWCRAWTARWPWRPSRKSVPNR